MNQKTGLKLWIQQILALMKKRFILFKGRYTLGLVTLILPILAEALICYVLPNQENLLDSISPPPGNYTFSLANYKTYTMPYAINDTSSSENFSKVFYNFYKSSKNPSLTIEKLDNDSIATFVLEKRKDINNLVRNYYTGLSFDIDSNNKISANAYYSTLAYHSGASVINEITNLLMAFYSNNLNQTITTHNTPLSATGYYTNIPIIDIIQFLSCIDVPPFSLNNFFNGIIISVFMSFFVAHVGRERINGSKHIQLLSGVHFVTYWIGNLIYDMIICLYTITGLVIAFKIMDVILNSPLSETFPIANGLNLFYYFILLLFSSFGWLMYAYSLSHFYKTEIVGFIVLLLVMAMAVFLDTIWCFLQFLLNEDTSLNNKLNKVLGVIRWVFVLLFPSVTIKRGLFDLKIRDSSYCIKILNEFFKSKFIIFKTLQCLFIIRFLKDDYKYNAEPLSFLEPGIGYLILISIFQFLLGAAILFYLESKLNLFKRFLCANSVDAEYVAGTVRV